jgi:hypothetical protein
MQLEVDEKSFKILTWNTHIGLFKINRLIYGITSAGAIFQATIECILAGIPGLFIYQDDILISALTEELCIERLDLLLGKLNSYIVQCQESKCRFLVPSVEYLGFLLDKDGLHPLPERVSAIKSMKIPIDADELRCFLGILNFYNKFLPEFSTIAAPLNILLCKRQKWT